MVGCWEQFRNVPHTQALTSCVLSGQPWNLPHPIHHPGIFCKAPSWGWVGEGLGGSGLTVPVPERVQLATLQACLMSAGRLQRRCLQPPNPICLYRSPQLFGSQEETECTLCWGARSHTCGGYTGVNRWAALYKPCLPATESWFLSAALPPYFPLPHLQVSLCLLHP